MRVVFMGTPDFAVPSLRSTAGLHDVVAVYTRPDSVSRRGSEKHPSAIKAAAAELGLKVREPTTLRDVEVQLQLRDDRPDVIVVAAYGLILPAEVLEIPQKGCINVHGSLLPRWRGAAPVQRAILAGDEMTGVSIMKMEEGLDTGPYCEVVTVEIADKNSVQLTQELADKGAEALVRALDQLEEGTCGWTDQLESGVTYAAKIEKRDVAMDPTLEIEQALRRVRASSPQAPARAAVSGRNIAIVDAQASTESVAPTVICGDKRGLLLGFSDGTMLVTRVRPEGKVEMAASDWTRGLRLSGSEHWSVAT